MVEALPPHPHFARRRGPVVLCILDGVGLGDGGPDDALESARTPTLDRLRAQCPWMPILAHGTAVGMPSDSDLGNSEVGHNAMGAGRVFDQGAMLVDRAIATGDAWRSETWRRLVQGRTLHLIGLVSAGNVHSHVDHLHALIDQAARDGVARLRVHVLTDGRDVSRRSALTWVRPLEDKLAALTRQGLDYRVGSGGGRMRITMDRYEADWSMVERGWRTHVLGEGRRFSSATEAIETAYAEAPQVDDQYVPPFVIADESGPVGTVEDGDTVLFINFRGDRAIEITRAFEQEQLGAFDRVRRPDVFYAGMMQYDGDLSLPRHFLVAPPTLDRTVGEFLVRAGLRSFACSETQKFGHVTYFFNGNRSEILDRELETWLEIPSDRVPFDERPWMKAAEITDAALAALLTGDYHHIRLNYPNGDMVGHTGHLEATRIAIEAVDLQLARLVEGVRKADGVLLVTADHGNADEMWMHQKDGTPERDPDGHPVPRTAHTTNPVPLIVYDPRDTLDVRRTEGAGIANLGATVLELCGLRAPHDYLPGLVRPRDLA